MKNVHPLRSVATVSALAAFAALALSGARAQAAPVAAPTAGAKPAVSVSGFEMPGNASASAASIKAALTAAKLTVGGSSAITYGENAHVTVLVTCTGLPSGKTRVEVVAASTDGTTADFYRKDLKARLEARDPRATPPGDAAPPTGGTAPVAQYGDFNLISQHLNVADKAMSAEGLTTAIQASGQHTGENEHVAVVVTWAITRSQTPIAPPDANGNTGLLIPDEQDRFVVISLSTNSATAEYYRNAVRNGMNPPPQPVRIR